MDGKVLIRGVNQQTTTPFECRAPLFPSVPPSSVVGQEMSPLVAPLASLLLLSGFAAAQIVAPDCSLTWGWVCFFFVAVASCRCASAQAGVLFVLQTFNSIDQNACTVAAYLMSTCNGGCECQCLPCTQVFASADLADSALLQRSPSIPSYRDIRTRARVVSMTPTCASVTPSRIHS